MRCRVRATCSPAPGFAAHKRACRVQGARTQGPSACSAHARGVCSGLRHCLALVLLLRGVAAGGDSSSAPPAGPAIPDCPQCDFFVAQKAAAATIAAADAARHVIRIGGVSKRQTGNLVTALQRAMQAAWVCKALLQLPDLTAAGQPFGHAPSRLLDYSRRPGPASALPRFCNGSRAAELSWKRFFIPKFAEVNASTTHGVRRGPCDSGLLVHRSPPTGVRSLRATRPACGVTWGCASPSCARALRAAMTRWSCMCARAM